MLKRNSNFTLIELIVVIVVLGILAAIVIPNISSFQDEAREVQLTADARNIQTALDMFQAKSDSGTEQPVKDSTFRVTASVQEGTDASGELEYKPVQVKNATTGVLEDGTATLQLLDMGKLQPDFLRKTPKYVKNSEIVVADLASAAALGAKVDYNKGQVVAAVLLNGEKSTSVVNFVTAVDTDTTAGVDAIAIVR